MANALDDWWEQLEFPSPFWVFEAGAGRGTLATAIIDARPRCLSVMRYVLIEQSASLRNHHSTKFALTRPDVMFDESDEAAELVANVPRIASIPELSDLGPQRFTGVVLANELLDNLPVDLCVWREGRWFRCHVDNADDGSFLERLMPIEFDSCGTEIIETLNRIVPDARDGTRVPWQRRAQSWLRAAMGLLDRGKVVCIDYAKTTASMSSHEWADWMRTYRHHAPGGSPYDSPGDQDITCDVAIDQLAHVGSLANDRSQAEFLEAYGLKELTDAARAGWQARGSAGDLESLRAMSRINEARALVDEFGLGAHRVLEWNAGLTPDERCALGLTY